MFSLCKRQFPQGSHGSSNSLTARFFWVLYECLHVWLFASVLSVYNGWMVFFCLLIIKLDVNLNRVFLPYRYPT